MPSIGHSNATLGIFRSLWSEEIHLTLDLDVEFLLEIVIGALSTPIRHAKQRRILDVHQTQAQCLASIFVVQKLYAELVEVDDLVPVTLQNQAPGAVSMFEIEMPGEDLGRRFADGFYR
jgi:hypothetical protein